MSYFADRDILYATGERYWCTECGEPCGIKLVDNGIGWDEYEGHQYHHKHVETISDCCECNVTDVHGNEVTPSDLNADLEANEADRHNQDRLDESC
jgi:hypothetical protein